MQFGLAARRLTTLLLSGPRVAERVETRENNFDAVRLLAALAVIISHAFPLSGDFTHEPGFVLSRGQVNLGEVAVEVFFVVSGFLITRSYLRSRNLGTFTRSRLLRIYPALIVSTVVTAFIFGPLVTNRSLVSYFSTRQTYSYLVTALLPYNATDYRFLPGVFAHNIVANTVNGSLWTIEGELLCYAFVALLGALGLLRARIVMPLLGLTVVAALAHLPIAYPWQDWLGFSRFFAAGMVLYLLRRFVPLNARLGVGAVVLIAASARFGHGLASLLVILLSYLVIWFALSPAFRLHWVGRRGDYSYGTYLYAFPIQQIVVSLAGGAMMPWLNVVLSVPLTLVCAALSWHGIEKRALALRRHSVVVTRSVGSNAIVAETTASG